MTIEEEKTKSTSPQQATPVRTEAEVAAMNKKFKADTEIALKRVEELDKSLRKSRQESFAHVMLD
jgi:hypothetical protein